MKLFSPRGEVNFRRRAPMQVAATLGFVLGRRNGQFLKGLRPKEVDAIREILVWGAQPYKDYIFVSDMNSGLYCIKIDD